MIGSVGACIRIRTCIRTDFSTGSRPLEQRFLTDADAPGTQPDPVETRVDGRQTSTTFMMAIAPDLFVDLDEEETTAVLQEAGFTWAAVDLRFFGETHKGHRSSCLRTIIELQSEDGEKACARPA